jgi:hypothetical protein
MCVLYSRYPYHHHHHPTSFLTTHSFRRPRKPSKLRGWQETRRLPENISRANEVASIPANTTILRPRARSPVSRVQLRVCVCVCVLFFFLGFLYVARLGLQFLYSCGKIGLCSLCTPNDSEEREIEQSAIERLHSGCKVTDAYLRCAKRTAGCRQQRGTVAVTHGQHLQRERWCVCVHDHTHTGLVEHDRGLRDRDSHRGKQPHTHTHTHTHTKTDTDTDTDTDTHTHTLYTKGASW